MKKIKVVLFKLLYSSEKDLNFEQSPPSNLAIPYNIVLAVYSTILFSFHSTKILSACHDDVTI